MEDELFNQEAELATLSILFKNVNLLYSMPDLQPFMFSSSQNAVIFEQLKQLALEGMNPEPDLLASSLQQHSKLDAAGGKEYIKYISTLDYKETNIKGFVNVIISLYKSRTLISLSVKIPHSIAGADDIDVVISQLRSHLDGLLVTNGGAETAHLSEFLPGTWDVLADRIATGTLPGLTTGFSSVDKVTGGYCPGDVWYIGSRPSQGKTSLMLCSAINSARMGNPSLLFEFEMNKQAIAERLLSIYTGIPLINIRLGAISNEELHTLRNGMLALKELPLYVDTSFSGDINYITSITRKYHYEKGVNIAFIDYVQLLAERSADATNELGRISRKAKLTANELGLTYVILTQVNRNPETRDDKRPILADLRQSGNLEEDADLVAALYRDEVYNPNTDAKGIMEFIIRKQRQGPIGTLQLFFEKEASRVLDR